MPHPFVASAPATTFTAGHIASVVGVQFRFPVRADGIVLRSLADGRMPTMSRGDLGIGVALGQVDERVVTLQEPSGGGRELATVVATLLLDKDEE